MATTLVLNADFSPMSVAPLSTLDWREAILKIYLDQVDVVEEYENWWVHSPSTSMKVPSVVVSRTYQKTSRSVKFNKLNICIRDDYTCQYCLQVFDFKSLTMEHVIPKSRGGKTHWTNICCACGRCNSHKGNRLHMKPHREPYHPAMGEISVKIKRMPIVISHTTWIPYIGWNPKLITVREPRENLTTTVK